MKKYLVLLISISFSAYAFSQSYIPFPTANAQWNTWFTQYYVHGATSGTTDDYMTYFTDGDTIINSETYTKLTKNLNHVTTTTDLGGTTTHSQFYFNQYVGSFRNDSTNKKVYFMPNGSVIEKVLYDFSLEAGDTINTNWFDYRGLNWPGIQVDSVDSILIDNFYHRRLKVSSLGNSTYLIEGIGSTTGILNPLIQYQFDSFLLCFSVNSNAIYPNSGGTCSVVSVEEEERKKVQIYPNPSNGIYRLNGLNDKCNIQIFDVMGRCIFAKQLLTDEIIDLTNQSSGIYFCKIQSESLEYKIKLVKN